MLYRVHFQNFKVYQIPKAQLIIADIPYNLGKNAYASNPSWYNDGDNKNGETIDMFVAHPDNWGYIFAIRTGSAEYSHNTLANGWVKKGFKGENGFLTKNGVIVPVKEETDLFKLIGVEYVEPKDRI